MIRVTVWNENLHEQRQPEVREIYPEGIHGCIAGFLERNPDVVVRTATFDEPEHGLTQEVLDGTDVLIYWSHMAQEDFSDEVAERIRQAVLRGMGLIALHSAHFSKMMKKLMGTSMTLRWRHGDRERLFVTAPSHPISRNLPEYFELPIEEMYGEYFDIPKPDDVVFTGWFAGGEVFRSGCTFQRGLGKIFYFQPGHEAYPTYHDRNIQKIIANAVYWCAPVRRLGSGPDCQEVKIPLEAAGRENQCGDSGKKNDACEKGTPENEIRESAKGQGEKASTRRGKVKMSVFYEHLREAAEQTGKSMEELYREAKKAGIDGIEIDYSVLAADGGIYSSIRDAGLEISNMYQFFDFGRKYAAGLHLGRKMIDTAKRLGIKRIMIIPGFLDEEAAAALNQASASYEQTAEYMAGNSEIQSMKEAIAELTDYASERDIMVSMEDFDSFDSPIARMHPIKWFLDQVPDLKHTLDMGNYAFSDEDAAEAYQLMKDRIGHVHCKDRGEEAEDDPEIWKGVGVPYGTPLKVRKGIKPIPVGDGYMPIAELVTKLVSRGYEGYLAIEHFGAPDQLGFMVKSAEFLKGLLEQ